MAATGSWKKISQPLQTNMATNFENNGKINLLLLASNNTYRIDFQKNLFQKQK